LNEKLLDCKVEHSNVIDNERIEVSDIRKVDVNSIKNEDSRTFGDEWLSKQVIDAGIATEENLKHLREKNLDSICVRRSNLSKYLIEMKHTRPNQEQARLYSALNFKQSNLQRRKKAVVPHS
jgi:hypothetical protein